MGSRVELFASIRRCQSRRKVSPGTRAQSPHSEKDRAKGFELPTTAGAKNAGAVLSPSRSIQSGDDAMLIEDTTVPRKQRHS